MNQVGQNIETAHPAIPAIMDRLKNAVDASDKLTDGIHSKLQSIKHFNPPHASPTGTEEPSESSECALDELNHLVSRVHSCNDRLERCLKHLDMII